MKTLNFIEDSIYSQIYDEMNTNNEGEGTLYIDEVQNGIHYFVEVDYNFEIDGFYDDDYTSGTGYFEVTSVRCNLNAGKVEAEDEDGETVNVELPTIDTREIENRVSKAIA